SGDTYIDHYSNGASLIGHYLISKGYKVGIIAQPDVNSDLDIKRLGEPELFWGVTAGSVDSMISNYTATKKRRNDDDLTPGAINNRRPDRATIVYCNLIRRYFKNTPPLVIGGVEASLRRIAHYDYWNNQIRRSILFDSKADILIYGMAEKSILELSERLKDKKDYKNIRGLCYISNEKKEDFIELPDFEKVKNDKNEFIKMFDIFYKNSEPVNANGLYQKHNDRYLIQNPPSFYLTEEELDDIYNLDYERRVHPFYLSQGRVKAIDTVQFSVTTHRGCYGECNFCSIALHQGRQIVSRKESSILKEVESLVLHPDFKGSITISAPTANMYKIDCRKKAKKGACKNKRCLYPDICNELNIDHVIHLNLLTKLKSLKGIKNLFVTSGLRFDMILKDEKNSEKYMFDILNYHTSGQLKIAPEHTDDKILDLMGKSDSDTLIDFLRLFKKVNNNQKKKKYLTYYFIAAHPGCDINQMQNLKSFIVKNLKIIPKQVQIFTPGPSTYSTLMYYTEINPFNNKRIFVEKNMEKKQKQKLIIVKNIKKN
ncbi:MAG: YgiQ family radical SAM protein, partial [Spirochaetes bacterium]|nr:YgiQ family radical SAM protein [Spirochaetota bacterium]